MYLLQFCNGRRSREPPNGVCSERTSKRDACEPLTLSIQLCWNHLPFFLLSFSNWFVSSRDLEHLFAVALSFLSAISICGRGPAWAPLWDRCGGGGDLRSALVWVNRMRPDESLIDEGSEETSSGCFISPGLGRVAGGLLCVMCSVWCVLVQCSITKVLLCVLGLALLMLNNTLPCVWKEL